MKTPDVLRMGRAMRQPGIDPRTWTSGGRIGVEGNTVRWDADIGWVLDVKAFGSGLLGETLMCRVATNHPYEFIPLDKDCEVVLSVPEGETDGIPTILGTLNNRDGCEAPEFFTGVSVDGSLDITPPTVTFSSTFGIISPYDNELKVSPHNRREEYGGDHVDVAANQVLEAVDQVRLASRTAEQRYVRGDRFTEVLGTLLDAISDYIVAAGTANAKIYGAVNGIVPGTVTLGEINDVANAVLQMTLPPPAGAKSSYDLAVDTPGDALSDRIKGE